MRNTFRKKQLSGAAPQRKSSANQHFSYQQLEQRQLLATVQIIAAGATHAEQLELQIDGSTVQTWENVGGDLDAGNFVVLEYSDNQTLAPEQLRVAFTNDLYDPTNNIDRNVRIDAIVIDGTRYESESPGVYSTGTWTPENGIAPGNWESEFLHGNGYFHYASDQNTGSEIQITASGSTGEENFDLQIDGTTVRSFSVGTTPSTFTYTGTGSITPDQIRVVFTNDRYEPANNIDANLHVDSISIDGTVYQTEAPNVYSTGTWLPEDGIEPGFRESETLHTNGYFQYGDSTQPGTIGLTLESLTIAESLGELTFIVFRSNGSDGEVTVDYATQVGTAGSADFQEISGTLTFADGIASQQVSLQITDDSEIESDESFSMVLTNPTGGAQLGAITNQVVTITDDDQVQSGIIFEDSFEAGDNWVTNPNNTDTAVRGHWDVGSPQATSSGSVNLQLDAGHTGTRALVTGLAAGSSAGAFDVDGGITSVWSPIIAIPDAPEIELTFEYYLSYLSNASNDDYFHASVYANGEEVTIFEDHAHDSQQSASWTEVKYDLSAYAGQEIRIAFSAADLSGGSLIEAAVDDVVIEVLPNLPGTISISTTGVNLDESSGNATVTVVRNNGRVGTVTVDYATASGTATTADYTPVSGTLTFIDGQAEATINIPILEDSIEESLESFQLQLSNAGGGAILGTDDSATITIVDNDNTVGDYLPDLTPVSSTLGEALSLDTNEIPGRRLLRFSTEVANTGDGPLEIWGGSVSGNSQQVFQRIYQEDGGSRDRLAGEFVYHAGHGHIHFEGFATYDLRLTNGNGDIVASGGKTSFCLINIRQPFPDATAAAGRVHGRGGSSCGQVQGISTGYSDVYSASLDDQWIDITGVADGTYWLEIVTDPEGNIQETNENNNSARIQIRLNNGVPSVAASPESDAPVQPTESYSSTGEGVVVAVIDTGIDWTHSNLTNLWTNTAEIPNDGIDNDGNGFVDDVHGYDFVDGDTLPMDENGHGTFTAGVIGANASGINGEAGPRGVASGAQLMAVRAIGPHGQGSFQAIADGIYYAVDNGADIINLSLESGDDIQLRSALEYASQHDVLIVAASGNQSSFAPSYVASQSAHFSNILAAGAVSFDGTPLPESNRLGGSGAIQLDASGIAFSTVPDNQFATYRGTSVATAFLSGAAALALSENPNLTAQQLRDVLIASADITSQPSESVGRLNPQAAIDAAARSTQVTSVLNGNRWTISTTTSSDDVEYAIGSSQIVINGIHYQVPNDATRLIVHAGNGANRLKVTGTSGNDHGAIGMGLARLGSADLVVVGHDFDYVNFEGGSGQDTLTMTDTLSNDHVAIDSQRVSLSSNGAFFGGLDFENIRVHSNHGDDTAQLNGTAGSDRFFGTPVVSRIQMPGVFAQISRFGSVRVDLGEGFDPAILRGGAQTETLTVTPTTAHFVNSAFSTKVSNLERTTSRGGEGADILVMEASSDRDVLNSRPLNSLLVGQGYDHRAYGFETTTVLSSSDRDRATLVGTQGNETLDSSPGQTTFTGTGFQTTVRNFPTVLINGAGGDDSAALNGSEQDDLIYFSPSMANIRNEDFRITALGFSNLDFQGAGGNDTVSLVDGSNNDTLKLYRDQARLEADDYFATFSQIESMRARSLSDSGVDTLDFVDSELDYSFEKFGDWSIR